MHHPSPMSSELGFLPAMYSFPGLVNIPEIGINIGPALGTSHHLPGVSPPNTSWERRCLRKHRRRADDEGCSAKRRRLMGEVGCNPLDNSNPNMCQSWPPSSIQPPVPEQPSPAVPQPCSESQSLGLPLFMSPPPLPCPEKEGSCMELEAAQRRLQEIEERITLEDDDDDEDLDVEPAQRRPVLVMSDSLREGLQRGIGDILPHTVAQSVSQSCMELVVWRPPEDALARRLKDSLQRQRKQQTTCRQPPTPSPSPTRQISLTPTAPPVETYSPLYHSPGAHSSGEEDMEL